MNEKLAKNLIKETFSKSFNLDNFEKFLIELFKNPKMKRENKTVKKGYRNHIESVLSLGSYRDSFDDVIGFYAVELKKSSSRDRARTMQRNIIADVISARPYRGAALVAFYESETDDWRFSYVKRGFEFRNGKLTEKLSSPKRHSFLVGPNEPNHTCATQFKELLIKENEITLENIEKAFNIEKVTDEFFEEYKKLILKLKKSLEDIIKEDPIVCLEFQEKNIDTCDFAKKLMGQLVFIYFLQKKGWLGLKKDDDWGTGPTNFLRRLFNKEYLDYENFFNDILEPLFYKGFCEPVRDYHFDQFGFKVPFLNGGLFEPMDNYDWVKTALVLKNEIFSDILDTFDLFNFTIKEDEPLEKEVAVDPEMLGKVFEKLLKIKDRKNKGAFYTPREIVHYMCQEALINYLNKNTSININDLNKFIREGDLALESIIKHHNDIKIYGKPYSKIKLPDSIKNNSLNLNNLLKDVKIVDLAVGSGAFPVGMMNEIVRARLILLLYNNIYDFSLYELKKETIENSLYCVDIESSATEITKLRFWLSLIVEEEDVQIIKPLPNLDNNVCCGNSLVDQFNGINLFNNDFIQSGKVQTTLVKSGSEIEFQRLEKKKREYFNEKSPLSKLNLKEEINNIKWNFIIETLKESGYDDEINLINEFKNFNSKPFFIWELEFSEIFKGNNPGFDIVIGNPPYIGEKNNKNSFDLVKSTDMGKKFAVGKMDYFYYFFHKGLDICKDKGTIVFITTNYFITADSAIKLRSDLKSRSVIKCLINFNEYKIFKSALGQHNLITVLEKNQNNDGLSFNCITKRKGLYEDNILRNIFDGQDSLTDYYLINQNDLYEGNENFIRISGISGANTGNEKNDKILKILEKIEKKGVKLKELCDVKTGLGSGIDKVSKRHLKLDDSYIIGEEVFVVSNKFFIDAPDSEKKYIKPLYKNSDIKRYYNSTNTNKYIIYTSKDIDVDTIPYIKNHLLKFKPLIEKIRKGAEIWYSLVRPREQRIFVNPKIIVPQRSKFNDFSYTEEEFYGSSDIYYIINKNGYEHINLKYILALLNSKLYYVWLYYKGKRKGENLELYNTPLSNIFVYNLDEKSQYPFIKLVNNLLDLYAQLENEDTEKIKDNIKDIENQLNMLIYNLYNLDEEEIDIIQNF